MSKLMVGVGQEIITPPIGTLLMGYTPLRPALGIHDDLHVTCFAMFSGETKTMLVAMDLCSLYYPLDQFRGAISAASGVPADHITVSCTHTHSGPTAQATEEGTAYVESILLPKAVKAAAAAAAAVRPALVGWGTTCSDVAVNRRQLQEDGKIVLGQDPHGTWDPTMTVIAFREPDGTPIGNIIQYGCHNTASGKNDEVTRDWCGVAIDRLQEISGGVTAFINGCGGDCGPRLPNGKTTANLQMAMELGGKAAIDAVRAWSSIREWRDEAVKVLHGSFEMPLADLGTAEDQMAQAAVLGDPAELKGMKLNLYKSFVARAEYLREGNIPPKTRTMSFTLFSIGTLGVCPLPFEIFSRITLRIKEHSPFAHTIVPGYSNGSFGYFPSMDQFCRGGYEVNQFRRKLNPFADNAEQALVEGCVRMLRELYEK